MELVAGFVSWFSFCLKSTEPQREKFSLSYEFQTPDLKFHGYSL
jgi:hypothetical protein